MIQLMMKGILMGKVVLNKVYGWKDGNSNYYYYWRESQLLLLLMRRYLQLLLFHLFFFFWLDWNGSGGGNEADD